MMSDFGLGPCGGWQRMAAAVARWQMAGGAAKYSGDGWEVAMVAARMLATVARWCQARSAQHVASGHRHHRHHRHLAAAPTMELLVAAVAAVAMVTGGGATWRRWPRWVAVVAVVAVALAAVVAVAVSLQSQSQRGREACLRNFPQVPIAAWSRGLVTGEMRGWTSRPILWYGNG